MEGNEQAGEVAQQLAQGGNPTYDPTTMIGGVNEEIEKTSSRINVGVAAWDAGIPTDVRPSCFNR